MRVRFYGRLGEKLGPEIEVELPAGTDIHDLRDVLARKYPDVSRDLHELTKACVADLIVGDDYRLDGIETVEFFPPLSGG